MNLLQIKKFVFSTKTNQNRYIFKERLWRWNLSIWANLPSRRNGRFSDQSDAKHVKYDEFSAVKYFTVIVLLPDFPISTNWAFAD